MKNRIQVGEDKYVNLIIPLEKINGNKIGCSLIECDDISDCKQCIFHYSKYNEYYKDDLIIVNGEENIQ